MFLLTNVHAHSSDTYCKKVVDNKVFLWIISLEWGIKRPIVFRAYRKTSKYWNRSA